MMMVSGGNADAKAEHSERVKEEEEEVARTVKLLRGRLNAERTAARNSKEEADLLEYKLIELEIRLKEETRSRNKAERRLKSVMKKLENLQIFFVSDESERLSFVEMSDISTPCSSVASTSTKEAAEDQKQLSPNPIITAQNIPEEDAIHTSPENYSFGGEIEEEEEEGGADVDNSLALVVVDSPEKTTEQRVDPAVLDATVKDVLDALKNAREKLQISMERRRMISVGIKSQSVKSELGRRE